MVVRRNRLINYTYDAQRMYKDWTAETPNSLYNDDQCTLSMQSIDSAVQSLPACTDYSQLA